MHSLPALRHYFNHPKMQPQSRSTSFLLLSLCWMLTNTALAQFAPAAGKPGSTAIKADSSCFVNWASNCHIQRGLKQINLPDSGFASVGSALSAIGPASSNGVVSLGDGGIATLTFNPPITNGEGFDFAVFENTFLDTFLELAFVEVSSDSLSWARFPSTSLTQNTKQTEAFGFTQPTQIHNLAGKYRHPYGTPFDLQDLAMMSNIRINEIRYVRIIDVVGSIDSTWGNKDSEQRIINDPWPTPFPSSGFDLDAVGVIHQQANMGVISHQIPRAIWFDQQTEILFIASTNTGKLEIFNVQGIPVFSQSTNFQTGNIAQQFKPELKPGTYIAKCGNQSIKIILTSTR
jgi:hypothetical protein